MRPDVVSNKRENRNPNIGFDDISFQQRFSSILFKRSPNRVQDVRHRARTTIHYIMPSGELFVQFKRNYDYYGHNPQRGGDEYELLRGLFRRVRFASERRENASISLRFYPFRFRQKSTEDDARKDDAREYLRHRHLDRFVAVAVADFGRRHLFLSLSLSLSLFLFL